MWGFEERGFKDHATAQLEQAFRLLFRSRANRQAEALLQAERTAWASDPLVAAAIAFLKRGSR